MVISGVSFRAGQKALRTWELQPNLPASPNVYAAVNVLIASAVLHPFEPSINSLSSSKVNAPAPPASGKQSPTN